MKNYFLPILLLASFASASPKSDAKTIMVKAGFKPMACPSYMGEGRYYCAPASAKNVAAMRSNVVKAAKQLGYKISGNWNVIDCDTCQFDAVFVKGATRTYFSFVDTGSAVFVSMGEDSEE